MAQSSLSKLPLAGKFAFGFLVCLLAGVAFYFIIYSDASDKVDKARRRTTELEGEEREQKQAQSSYFADRDELAATLIDGMRRALTLEQLPLGRVLAREAIAADLDPEDLVYVALWLSLLERRAGAEPDGTVAEALGKVSTRTGWIGALRAWGSAELDDAGLLGAARSPAERTEARFYTAMAGRAGGDLAAGLAAVAESPAIELVEVTLARDLLAAGRPGPRPSLPPDVTLP